MNVSTRGMISLLLVVGLVHAARVDYEGYTEQDLAEKHSKFTTMCAAGGLLLALGLGGIIGGSVLCSQADWDSQSSVGGVTVTTNDSEGAGGIILLGFGIPLSIAGTVLTSIGGKKTVEYKRRLRTMRLGYDPRLEKIVGQLVWGL